MRIGLLVVFVFLFILQVAAQTPKNIKVDVRKAPLDRVLFDLRESYGFQFAFDSDLLSQYNVTVNRTFDSEEETLLFLIRNLPLAIEKSGDVFIIMPLKQDPEPEPAFTRISGQVVEAQTYEPLPFSYIMINQKSIRSDQQGNFNFIASADTSYNLRISHLGYFIYDTTITQSLHKQFLLMPRIERIQEVKVLGNPVERSTLIGDNAGRIKINHRIAPILPGHGDNSVFNLLRLMPGVLAAGEQSNDLMIWGAYESHSKIQFDGFTVFGLKNFNDNISVVNPFMVKNIEVMKGGYEARYGGRVGGIVDITGKNGTLQKPTFTFNINNTTVNTLVQLPLSERSSLIAAYRQTYYQLYDPTSLNLFGRNDDKSNNGKGKGSDKNDQSGGQDSGGIDFSVQPDFKFQDANLKYSYLGEKGGRFSVSLYGGGDNFLYDMTGETTIKHPKEDRVFTLSRSEEEQNRQFGSSLQLDLPWENGDITRISGSYSMFSRTASEQNKTINQKNDRTTITKKVDSENNVDEATFNAEHTFSFVNGHRLVAGAGAINNKVQLLRESKDEKVIDLSSNSPRLVAFLQDELPVGNFLDLKTGVRMIYATELNKVYVEPRASASFKITDGLKFNASWGLYNQFMAKTSLVDSALNYSYFWTNANGEEIPVLSAQHFVGGLSFNKNGFTASAEGYYKTTDGITRWFNGNRLLDRGFYKGDARSYGLDLYLKKEYKRHVAWVSYTLSQTEEHFPFYVRDIYKPAPHHQKHEVKFAGIINLKSFYLSANYVYGSGFERFNVETDDGTMLNQDYKRLDAALVYRFRPGRIKAEAGLSVLNVLDTENIKYSNLRRATVDDVSLVGIYAEAVPFTPTLFLKIEL